MRKEIVVGILVFIALLVVYAYVDKNIPKTSLVVDVW